MEFFDIHSHACVPAHGHGHDSLGVRDIEMQTGAIERWSEARSAFRAALELPLPGLHIRGVGRKHVALQSTRERELPPARLGVQKLHSPDILGRQQRDEIRLDFRRLKMCIESQPDIDGVIRERENPSARRIPRQRVHRDCGRSLQARNAASSSRLPRVSR